MDVGRPGAPGSAADGRGEGGLGGGRGGDAKGSAARAREHGRRRGVGVGVGVEARVAAAAATEEEREQTALQQPSTKEGGRRTVDVAVAPPIRRSSGCASMARWCEDSGEDRKFLSIAGWSAVCRHQGNRFSEE